MKKSILFLFFLIPLIGFSQSINEKIQTYLDTNRSKFGLTTQDVQDWIIESTGNSESTGMEHYYVLQRYQGIEIFRAVTNFSFKDGAIFTVGNRFVVNVSQKANATTPSLSVLEALNKAHQILEIHPIEKVEIIETINSHKFKISNGLGLEDPINANLVFHQSKDDKLFLSWDFTIETNDHKHIWSVRIDALNGKLLEKNDQVISCNFEPKKHNFPIEKTMMNDFTKKLFKSENLLSPAGILGGSYKVIPFNYESPNHTSFQLITNPENATASPKGWHDTNTLTGTTATLKYTITRGNNVWARSDYLGTNPVAGSTTPTANGYSPNGGSTLTFNFPYNGTAVAANTSIDAACTNLFYEINICHDLWQQYGFNEANGNFQQTNYTGTTGGADFVYGDAQDGSTAATPTLNNANFSAPVDGSKGRMQMYLWTYRKITQLLNVNSPSDIAGLKYASDNGFNPGHVNVPVAPAKIQSDLVLFDDGTPDVGQTDNADGCSAAVNAAAISGHIAVIRRSTSTANGGNPCSFVQKALNAQAAGATALIIVNNDTTAPNSSIGMSGADATITIPVISVSSTNGEAIITKLKANTTVNATIQSPTQLDLFVNTDGDFDNGVINHEFGHGISIRLAGGKNNSSCLQNDEQMGEGWSDWFALMLQMKPGDVGTTPRGLATFVAAQDPTGYGIRNYPYTTDMTINPETFKTVNSNQYDPGTGVLTTEPHNVGEVWATMLWDLTWAYVAKYGYDDNKYSGTGGNNKLMQLVLDAIKLQPCSPTFVEARDAIIAADQAKTGGADYCMIYRVFARRGLGLNADSGSRTSSIDEVEDFTVPTSCVLGTNIFYNENNVRVYPNPSNGQYNIHINEFVGKVSIQVVDLNGRLIYNASNMDFNSEKTIDLSAFQSGVYILKMSGDNLNFSQKLIKN